jgi:hypothetical protein
MTKTTSILIQTGRRINDAAMVDKRFFRPVSFWGDLIKEDTSRQTQEGISRCRYKSR